jgi:Dyp-type peroxidase family
MGLLDHPDLQDIQGDVIPGFRSREDLDYAQHFLLLRVADAAQARKALRGLVPLVTSGAMVAGHKRASKRLRCANVGFTFTGLRALGLDLRSFEGHKAFSAGLAARSGRKIRIDDKPKAFDIFGPAKDWRIKGVHVVVSLGAADKDSLADHVADVKARVTGGFRRPTEQAAAVRGGEQREVFGFREGLAQPRVAGFHAPRPGIVAPRPSGEFLLADGDPLLKNGSFMVWLRFVQDRAKFDLHCAQVAKELRRHRFDAATAASVAAMEVGRWMDGTSLTRSPVRVAAPVRNSGDRFNYREDYFGRGCPRFAHARKMNPRTGNDRKHAILRRGIAFQEGAEEGLIFVCYQASIEDQFEWLQAYWANAVYAPERNASPDPLISQRAREGFTMEVPLPGGGSVPVKVTNDWVTPTGGFYAFVPSLSGLRHLLRDG